MGNSDDNPSGESHPTPPLQPAPAPAAGEVGDTLEVQRKKGVRRDIVCTLESQRIIKEVHVLSGQCGHCVRHVASCVYCETIHEGCDQKRSISEPWTFLSCWLQFASFFGDRASHVSVRPSLDEARGYAKEQEWVSQQANMEQRGAD